MATISGGSRAFDSGEIAWDINRAPFRLRAVETFLGMCESAKNDPGRMGVVRSRYRTTINRVLRDARI